MGMRWWSGRGNRGRGLDEAEIMALWTAAEQALDGNDLSRAFRLFTPACDAVVQLATLGRRKAIPFHQAAELAATYGVSVPANDPMTAAAAREIASAAKTVMPMQPAVGMRLALEAHVMFLMLSNRQTVDMRYLFVEFGPSWVDALLVCSRHLEEQLQAMRLALHFARWAANVSGHLVPFRDMPEINEAIRKSLVQARHMEAMVGDPSTAQMISQLLAMHYGEDDGDTTNPG